MKNDKEIGSEKIILSGVSPTQQGEGYIEFVNYLEKKFVEVTSAILLAIDKAGKVMFINKKGCELLGYGKDEVIGKDWFANFVAGHDKEKARLVFKQVLSGNIKLAREADIAVITSNQEKKLIRWKNTILYNKQGKVIGSASSGEDITEKNAHEVSQNYLAAIIDSSDDAIISLTLGGDVRSWNKGAEKMYGYTAEEMIGKKADILLPESKRNEIDRYIAGVLKDLVVEPFETRRLTKHGNEIDVSLSIYPVKDAKGRVIAISTIGRDITQRKDDEQFLKASRNRYRRIFHNIQDVYYETSMEGTILEISPSIERHSGYKREDLIGKSVYDYYQKPEEREGLLEQLKKNNCVNDYEITLRTSKGDNIVCSFSCSLVSDEKGQKIIVGSFRNINDRKQAEKKHLESEEKYRNLFRTNRDAIVVADGNNEIIDCNRAFTELFQYTGEGIKKNKLPVLYDEPKDFKRLSDAIKKDKGKKGFSLILNYKKQDKHSFKGETNVFYLKGEEKASTVMIIKDISERIAYEKKIKYESTVNFALAEVAEELLLPQTSCDSIYHTIQQFALELTLSRQTYTGIVNPETGNMHIEFFAVFDDEQYQAVERSFVINGKSNDACLDVFMPTIKTKKTYVDNAVPKPTENDYSPSKRFLSVPVLLDNKLIGLLAVGASDNDYTEDDKGNLVKLANLYALAIDRINQENILKEAKQRAEESDHLKSAFLTNMSHEIRTPLNGIIGFSELINKKDLSVEKRKYFSEIIKRNSNSLLNLINDIIDVSKIEAGQLNLDVKECNINEIINDVFLNAEVDMHYKHKENLSLEKHMLLDEGEAMIRSDPFRLKQVLINLVNNAIKFTEEGTIKVGYAHKGCFIEFYVEDTGMGIAKEQQKYIFERFRQGDDSLTREYGGSGLGLSICKGLVEMLGGDVYLRSVVDKGTTFYFTIPYERAVGITEKQQVEEDHHIDLRNKRLLVVEDDGNSYSLIQEIMNPTKAELFWVQNGEDAVKAVEDGEKIDLVLMDIRLPVIDGYEATSKIKKLNKDLPVIAQTAHAFGEQKEKAFEAGCDDYITKPYTEKDMLITIAKYINKTFLKDNPQPKTHHRSDS